MQNILIVSVVFLYAFTWQSLPLLLCRSNLMKVLPLAMFLVPLTSLMDVYVHSPGLFPETVISWLDLIIPMLIGDIAGWILGFQFRKIIDIEKEICQNESSEEETKDNISKKD